ncbi:MAG: efflux RND transporter periplasmic adaptor subunit [candidate division Zixibacteria bacterium]
MIRKLIMISIIAASGISCGEKNADVSMKENAVAVTVEAAALRNLDIENIYTGTMEGIKQARIFSSIPEAVVELPVTEGSKVKAGQPIINLDKEGVYSNYRQTRAVYKDAKDNYNKMKNLYEQGAISEQAFNSARTGYDVAKANYTSAKQQVELTSPIDGVLTDLSVNIGEFVPLGISLATVAQTDRMRMTLFVDAGGASTIKTGQTADIDIDMLGENPGQFTGTVTDVSQSADPVTRLFKIEILINNKDGEIKPGMYARARLTVSGLKSVLSVPREALFSVEGVQKVFLLLDNRAVERTVKVGESTNDFVRILSGLSEIDTVIVIGRNLVEDGSPVKVAAGNNDGDEEHSGSVSGAEG